MTAIQADSDLCDRDLRYFLVEYQVRNIDPLEWRILPVTEDLEPEMDMSNCPYYRQDGSLGHYGPNTCLGGCYSEPACVTMQPEGGWPSERETHMDKYYYGMLADSLQALSRQLEQNAGVPETADEELVSDIITGCNELASQLRQFLEYDS